MLISLIWNAGSWLELWANDDGLGLASQAQEVQSNMLDSMPGVMN